MNYPNVPYLGAQRPMGQPLGKGIKKKRTRNVSSSSLSPLYKC